MNLDDMRTLVRRDLHDEDPADQRWSDAELDRHIQHALRDLGYTSPLEARASLTTAQDSRDLDITGLSDLIQVEAVEHPTGQYPAQYVRFSVWAGTLTLLVDRVPQAGEEVAVYYGKLHTLDATTSTLPPHLEDVLATGAEAYAALEWASFATNRVNTGGEDTWRAYQAWGHERLAAFLRALSNHSQRNRVRARRLYVPAPAPASQTTDWGP